MACKICKKLSVSSSPSYCREHFIEYFEKKVRDCIRQFGLMSKSDKIAVAVSGGKDSMSLLHVLNKLGYSVSAVCVDEGIYPYRDNTLEHMKKYCKKNNISYKIVSFEENYGKSLDNIVKKKGILPCSVCGVFRRRLINTYSTGFDAVATGHNMDDECQAIIMNLLKTNVSLLTRLGPVSGKGGKQTFTKRVKPFYLCSEKDIMIYAFLNNLNTKFEECPYVGLSFRQRIRGHINDIEVKRPGTKKGIIDSFLRLKLNKTKVTEKKYCVVCGEPSSMKVCSVCSFVNILKTTSI